MQGAAEERPCSSSSRSELQFGGLVLNAGERGGGEEVEGEGSSGSRGSSMSKPCSRPAGRRGGGRRRHRRAPSCAFECCSVPCTGGDVEEGGKRKEVRVLLVMQKEPRGAVSNGCWRECRWMT